MWCVWWMVSQSPALGLAGLFGGCCCDRLESRARILRNTGSAGAAASQFTRLPTSHHLRARHASCRPPAHPPSLNPLPPVSLLLQRAAWTNGGTAETSADGYGQTRAPRQPRMSQLVLCAIAANDTSLEAKAARLARKMPRPALEHNITLDYNNFRITACRILEAAGALGRRCCDASSRCVGSLDWS